jgi:hypothetical protein
MISLRILSGPGLGFIELSAIRVAKAEEFPEFLAYLSSKIAIS